MMNPSSMRKTLNAAKAKVERQRGPVSKDQDAVPLADAMRDYWEQDRLSFSIPAHAGGRGPAPEFTGWAGIGTARFDLPLSHGVDTRDRAWGVQSTAQELFTEAVGAKETLFSTNGSTMSTHVAMMAVAGPGENLVMARNGHKSAFTGLVLSGALPVYVDPVYDEELSWPSTRCPRTSRRRSTRIRTPRRRWSSHRATTAPRRRSGRSRRSATRAVCR
jgi:arginine decarboxylase